MEYISGNAFAYTQTLKTCDRLFLSIICMGTSWVALSIKNIKTRASREMTSRKKDHNFIL